MPEMISGMEARGQMKSLTERIQEAFHLHVSIPSLSPTVLRFVELMDQGQLVSPETLQVAACDPGLAAILVRSAASAHFAQSRPVSDVRSALQVLGTKGARAIAYSTLLYSSCKLVSSRCKLNSKSLIGHSLMVSILAKFLLAYARKTPTNGPAWTAEEVATAGILHELPWVGFSSHFPVEFDMLYEDAVANGSTMEIQFSRRYKYEFGDFAQFAFDCWRLPEELGQLVNLVVGSVGRYVENRQVLVLRLANVLAENHRFQLIPLKLQVDTLGTTIDELGLTQDIIDEGIKVATNWTMATMASRAA